MFCSTYLLPIFFLCHHRRNRTNSVYQLYMWCIWDSIGFPLRVMGFSVKGGWLLMASSSTELAVDVINSARVNSVFKATWCVKKNVIVVVGLLGVGGINVSWMSKTGLPSLFCYIGVEGRRTGRSGRRQRRLVGGDARKGPRGGGRTHDPL